ncbi:MAG: ATP synthase subunit I [Gammaproteobacteria bacterium]|nr:ATP synthase subunit I [Gammaproteobacteria bacterium]
MASGVRKLLVLQLLLIAVTSVVFFLCYGGFQAGSVWYGGAIACANSLLLEWRRYRVDSGRALSAGTSLRVLYRSALERFLLVLLLFALGLGVLQLEPLALLTGFIAGQLGLVITGIRRKN